MTISKQAPQRFALITGASAGIGAAFAQALAKQGTHLVLTARRTERLMVLADALKSQYSIQVDVITSDLADPATPQWLHAELERRGIAIDILINNAGYGVPGRFDSQPWSAHADFIQVLMAAPVELCHRFLPSMQARGYGRIINVASLAGYMPGSASQTLYSAAKAFFIKFSQSLALENQHLGIHVCALCPGFTYSEFHDVTGTRPQVAKMPKWMWMTAEEVVDQGLDAVEHGRIVYVNGRVNRLIKFIAKHLPDGIALKLINRHAKTFRNQN